ncbi:hypothetical protein LUQ84_001527 [Hamiltosporidium tvaerminnensis]|nr:hypothetical protein LUQ84_001527 [Hamiltosporidium tvaerminnensis]
MKSFVFIKNFLFLYFFFVREISTSDIQISFLLEKEVKSTFKKIFKQSDNQKIYGKFDLYGKLLSINHKKILSTEIYNEDEFIICELKKVTLNYPTDFSVKFEYLDILLLKKYKTSNEIYIGNMVSYKNFKLFMKICSDTENNLKKRINIGDIFQILHLIDFLNPIDKYFEKKIVKKIYEIKFKRYTLYSDFFDYYKKLIIYQRYIHEFIYFIRNIITGKNLDILINKDFLVIDNNYMNLIDDSFKKQAVFSESVEFVVTKNVILKISMFDKKDRDTLINSIVHTIILCHIKKISILTDCPFDRITHIFERKSLLSIKNSFRTSYSCPDIFKIFILIEKYGYSDEITHIRLEKINISKKTCNCISKFRKIKSLEISFCKKNSELFLKKTLETSKELEILKLNDMYISRNTLKLISKMNLSKISFKSCRFEKSQEIFFTLNIPLCIRKLNFCRNTIEYSFFIYLEAIKNLESLNISFAVIMSPLPTKINLGNLKKINLTGIKSFYLGNVLMYKMNNLRKIIISEIFFFHFLTKPVDMNNVFYKIKEIKIPFSLSILRYVNTLKEFNCLEKLTMENTFFKQNDFLKLDGVLFIHTLQYLKISAATFGNNDILILKKFNNLQFLGLIKCSLDKVESNLFNIDLWKKTIMSLDLRFTKINDEDINNILQFENLKYLSLTIFSRQRQNFIVQILRFSKTLNLQELILFNSYLTDQEILSLIQSKVSKRTFFIENEYIIA